MKKLKRLSFVVNILIILIFVWCFNIKIISNTRIKISSNKIKDEIKIVQISDLHRSIFGINNNRIVRKIYKINPDFIVVTGDMYTAKDEKSKKRAILFLEKLALKYKIYFVNGEHDNNKEFFDKLKEKGINVLDYKKEDIYIKNSKINIYGINNVYYSKSFNLKNEFEIDKNEYNILLAHIPNVRAFKNFGIDLAISGDTHGGQIRIPFIGAIYNNGVFLPELNRKSKEEKYTKGLYEEEKSKIIVSSGLGYHKIPVRLFNLPEIVIITVVPKI